MQTHQMRKYLKDYLNSIDFEWDTGGDAWYNKVIITIISFAYESDDSWNSADSFNQSLKNIGNDDNRIMLLCPENMDESNSQDGLDDEFGNR